MEGGEQRAVGDRLVDAGESLVQELLGLEEGISEFEIAYGLVPKDRREVALLSRFAQLASVALDNARLFAASQQALEAAGRAYGEVSRRGWVEMVRARPDLAFRSDERGVTSAAQIWRPEMEQAMETGRSVLPGAVVPQAQAGQAERPDRIPLAVPIKVRGEVVGVLDTYRSEGAWSDQEVTLLETIADQLGTALESSRLYYDTQRRALQERMVGEVTAKMRETLDVEAVVKTAVDEIYKTINLSEVSFYLTGSESTGQMPADSQPPGELADHDMNISLTDANQ